METELKYRKLDLGGTACYEDPGSTIIDLDATNAGDEVTPMLQGDYDHAPFPNNCFDEACGSCYLELPPNWSELYRILKPGATAMLKACNAGYAPIEDMAADMLAAGFIILEMGALGSDERPDFSDPYWDQHPEAKQSQVAIWDYIDAHPEEYEPDEAGLDSPFIIRKPLT